MHARYPRPTLYSGNGTWQDWLGCGMVEYSAVLPTVAVRCGPSKGLLGEWEVVVLEDEAGNEMGFELGSRKVGILWKVPAGNLGHALLVGWSTDLAHFLGVVVVVWGVFRFSRGTVETV